MMAPTGRPAMAHLLIVDDDHGVRAMLEDYLGARGHRVSSIASGAEIERYLASEGIDLVLLDINLPKEDGFSILQRVRMRGHAAPVILLTSRADQVDKVLGLEVGADDYITKPFDLREVEARIKTVLRRGNRAPASAAGGAAGAPARSFRFGDWELNLGTRRLTRKGGAEVLLTNAEFSILHAFLLRPRQVLSRDDLIVASRLHHDVYERTVDTTILRLRRKIEPDSRRPRFITTARGAGYVFDCEVTRVC
jgi:two-component system, OmpR family, response regulator